MKYPYCISIFCFVLTLASANESFPNEKIYGKSADNVSSAAGVKSIQTQVTVLLMSSFVQAIENYQKEYNQMPEGGNQAILDLLAGAEGNRQNRRLITFFNLRGTATKSKDQPAVFLSSERELLDGWGRPMIIQRSARGMAILSTGEDGILNQSADKSDSSDDIYLSVKSFITGADATIPTQPHSLDTKAKSGPRE